MYNNWNKNKITEMKNVITWINSRSEQAEKKKNQQIWRTGNWNGQVWRPGRNEIWVLDEERERKR